MSPGADGASVLVTGGLGYVGKKVVAALASHSRAEGPVVSLDIRPPTPEERVPGRPFA